jgi:cardiolipin synthase (CMP-forming)
MVQSSMDAAAAKSESSKSGPKKPLVLSLPNVLTYMRILAVPAVMACLLGIPTDLGRWLALTIYVLACITDWLDGYLARVWQQQSTLGRMLDPIADKLLVGATLLVLTSDHTITNYALWAATIILCREILVSGLREFLAELNVKIHVTQLAKWKTTLQMIALGVLIAGPAGDKVIPHTTDIGLALLWVAALLTLMTGYDYLKAAVRHAIDH